MGGVFLFSLIAAFDQVAPLVAQGFTVLETTKNIAILLAFVQVLTLLMLGCILVALLALVVTVHPGLVRERDRYVTPTMRTLLHQGVFFVWATGGVVLFSLIAGGLYIAIYGGTKMEEVDGENAADKDDEKTGG